jgi:hypothetical protein
MAGVGAVVVLPARLLRVSGGRGREPGLSSSALGVESQPGLSTVAGEAQPRSEGLGLPAASRLSTVVGGGSAVGGRLCASASGAAAAAAAAGLRLQGLPGAELWPWPRQKRN